MTIEFRWASEIRARHQPTTEQATHVVICRLERQAWPCDAIQALDALEKVEQEQRFDQLARAERVVEAARGLQRAVSKAQTEMPEGRWFGAAINGALAVLEGELRAHDAEVGR